MESTNATVNFASVELLTECSWEVCNKIGGIYTVLSTKAVELKKIFGDRLVFIGPDFKTSYKENSNPLFKERKTLLKSFSAKKLPYDLKIRCGRWSIPGSPLAILVDFSPIFAHLNGYYGEMWENFGVDSLHSYGDYDESCAFAIAASIVAIELGRHLKIKPENQIVHYNEWTTGMGLLNMKLRQPETATIFTTHATTIGRSICGNGKPLYQYFNQYNGDQMSRELNVESKHSLEKAAAWNADCFTTVSEVTSDECAQLLGRRPDVVTPNGFEPSFVPDESERKKLRKKGREKILKISSLLNDGILPDDTFIVATSGRNEYRNKGLDLFLDSIELIAERLTGEDRKLLALVLVPAWVKQPSGDLLVDLDFGGWIKPEPDYLTHRLNNEDSDAVACNIRRINSIMKEKDITNKVKVVFVPSYLNGEDGILNIKYYDFLPALDLTVFGSYYEPWGYTPLESIAFGVPTITTDKAGFGKWVESQHRDNLESYGVSVVKREDYNYLDNGRQIAEETINFMRLSGNVREEISKEAEATAAKAEWKFFISHYIEAFQVALDNALKRNETV